MMRSKTNSLFSQTIWEPLPNAPETNAVALQEALFSKEAFPIELAHILYRRGIHTLEDAKSFFSPQKSELHDPFLMKGMDVAVDRLLKARAAQEVVLLFGDYDVDGTSATALLRMYLQSRGWKSVDYIPDRYKEGYGISYQGINFGKEHEASLMVSLDCGIKAIDQIRYAKTQGVDAIICDHHTPGTELPAALAVLDPKQTDCPYPYKELTGCGVGFKLIQALHQQLTEAGENFPDPFEEYVDLVTLSIACDIVPITGENRAIAHYGLQKIRSNPLPGIGVIMQQAKEERSWDISDLVFFVGPRLNAAGRLRHGSESVEVLAGKGQDLIKLAHQLQQTNDDRKSLDKEITDEALALIDQDPEYPERSTTVLYQSHWHKGVIGIVASRLIETHYRPTVMLTESDGKLVGSARSVKGFNLYEALLACQEHLLQFGGHKYAAGLSMHPDAFPAFCQKFDQIVAQSLRPEQKIPALCIDQFMRFSKIDARLIRLINRMAPFGPGNPRPVFMAEGVLVRHTSILKEVHLKMVLEQDGVMLEAIGFQLAETWLRIGEGLIDIAFQPIFNTWNGKTRINLRLKDIRPSSLRG
ncbi:MAG: single-stranded-DNA-specific exonuclease RecJ [Bacteroidota bacterium]